MLTILGPAKTINTSPHGITKRSSFPQYIDQAEELVDQIRRFSISQLKSLMKVSDKLATLNFERYASCAAPTLPKKVNRPSLHFPVKFLMVCRQDHWARRIFYLHNSIFVYSQDYTEY